MKIFKEDDDKIANCIFIIGLIVYVVMIAGLKKGWW